MVVAAGFDINALKPFIKGIDINVKGTMLEIVFKFDFGSEEIAKTMAVAVGQQLREIMG
jgi:hypothetical protein